MGLCREIIEEWQWYRRVEGGGGVLSPLRQPGFWVMAVHRFGWRSRNLRLPVLGTLARATYVFGRFFILAVTGADIRSGVRIGRRFTIHTSQGIMIADGASIGDDCVIYTGVCIVHRANGRGEGVAAIGHGVRMGVGCKILGKVTIGDRAVIGANAVVLCDVPACSLAVGVPATIKSK